MLNRIILFLMVMLLCIGAASADQDVYENESIQAAINNATFGETVWVHAGTYIENLRVSQNITLAGDGARTTFLQASVESSPAIHILASNANVTGFDISGSWWGIRLDDVWFGTISNNVIHDNRANIEGRDICHIRILNNTIYNGGEDGIYTIRSSHMYIVNNTVYDNSCLGGVFISMGGFNTVKGNVVYNNSCKYGGITIYSSNWNAVCNNHAYDNGYGIYLCWSEDNTICNNFCEDGGYAYSSHPNNWNLPLSNDTNIAGGNNSGGNFWGDYIGIDSDGDGIGDTPYHIPTYGPTDEDELPLVSPKCGDCDWNGYTSANDVIEAYRKAVDPTYHIPHVWVVDVDGNGYISANDVVEIYRRAVDPNYKLHCVLNT